MGECLCDEDYTCNKHRTNMFHDAEDVTALLHQVVGAGSVCWENPGGAGVFDDAKARDVAKDGIERLEQITGMMWSN